MWPRIGIIIVMKDEVLGEDVVNRPDVNALRVDFIPLQAHPKFRTWRILPAAPPLPRVYIKDTQ